MSRVKPGKRRPPVPALPDRPSRLLVAWRRQRRLIRPGLLLSVVAVAGIALVAAVHALGQGPGPSSLLGRAGAKLGLRVERILVEGRQKTPEPQLLAALGVSVGDPMLSFSLAAARGRVESIRWVQQAVLQRRLPDTLVVQLTERRPFAVWQHDGRFVLVDRAGDLVTDSDVGTFAADLPLVVGPGAPEAAAALLDAMAAQPDVASHVSAAVRVGERRWNLRLKNGADVLLPEGNEPAALARLAQLQATHALLDRPVTVDMRLPDRLVIRALPGVTVDPKDAAAPPARRPT